MAESMKIWNIQKSELVFENRFFTVQKDTCETPAGKKEYFFKTGRGAALIFAVTTDQQVILEQQYRHPIKQVCYDFPAGAIELNEKPEECARRELREETGYTSEKWVDLGWAHCSPGSTEEKIYMFLALEAVQLAPPKNPDVFEHIQLELIPLSEISNNIGEKINCALCISTAFFALRYLSKSKNTVLNDSLE